MSKKQDISKLPIQNPQPGNVQQPPSQQPPDQPPDQPPVKKSSSPFRWLLIGILLIVVYAICRVFIQTQGETTPTPTAVAQQEVAVPTEEPAEGDPPTPTTEPTEEPEEEGAATPRPTVTRVPTRPTDTPSPPTNTPEPTATPLPTDTPTITPTPLPPTATFTPEPPTATPAPIVLSGSGDSVIDVPGSGPMIAKISGNAEASHFAVEALDSNNEVFDLLVNTVEPYQGVRPVNFDETQAARFQVSADGPWTIELQPLEAAPVFVTPGEHNGNGDQVLILDGTAEIGTFNSSGTSNFAVLGYGGDFPDLLVNEIAPYQGQVIVPRTSFILVIQATGPWSIKME